MELVTKLTSPPVMGRKYLVPTVLYPWLAERKPRAWPVFLPKHSDADHLNFPHEHYHVDPRFVCPSGWKAAAGYDHTQEGDAFKTVQRTPLQRRNIFGLNDVAHPDPVWRARTCYRTLGDYRFSGNPMIVKMSAHFAGTQCAASRSGWICPHRKWPLGSVAPDEHGIITCPLHGLRIVAGTGRVVSQPRPAPSPATTPMDTSQSPDPATGTAQGRETGE